MGELSASCPGLKRDSAEHILHYWQQLLPTPHYDFEVANCNLKMNKRSTAKLLDMPKRRGSPPFAVESHILFLRHRRVILDVDLAELYGVTVKRLNQQVTRNAERFPSDFMFQISAREHEVLRLQIATSKTGSGGRRYLPYAFTEHGAIMAATVLNSKMAVAMSVFVVRAFVRLREMLATNRRLAAKIYELEKRMDGNDETLIDLFDAIRELMAIKPSTRRRIGFQLPAAK